MNINFIKFIILISGLLLPLSVVAGLVPCTGDQMCTFCDLLKLIRNIVNFIAFTLAPAVGGLMLLVGGIIVLTAGGDETKVKQGRGMITQTVIGLVIIYLAWLIVNTVITGLASTTGTWQPENWWVFINCP